MLDSRPKKRIAPWVRFWLRLALRCLVWGSVLLVCGVACLLNSCLELSPKAYQSLHENEGWIPLDSLSTEARGFAEIYYDGAEFSLARIQGIRAGDYPPLLSPWLYQLTLEEDAVLQLVLSNATKCSPLESDLQLEDLLAVAHGDPRTKQARLCNLLRSGGITPERYREASAFLASLEP